MQMIKTIKRKEGLHFYACPRSNVLLIWEMVSQNKRMKTSAMLKNTESLVEDRCVYSTAPLSEGVQMLLE
jgi:hypothetical protein